MRGARAAPKTRRDACGPRFPFVAAKALVAKVGSVEAAEEVLTTLKKLR